MPRSKPKMATVVSLAIAVGMSVGSGAASSAEGTQSQPLRRDIKMPSPAHAKLTPSVKPVEAKPGQTVDYEIKVTLDPGWVIFPYTSAPPKQLRRIDLTTSAGQPDEQAVSLEIAIQESMTKQTRGEPDTTRKQGVSVP